MKKRTFQSAFFNLRVLIGLLIMLTGLILALLGFGTFAAPGANITQTQQGYTATNNIDPRIPAGFDCSKIHELGIDKQMNFRAGAIMIFCGLSEGGTPLHGSRVSRFIQKVLAPVSYGGLDVDVITGAEIFPYVTQSTTFSTANPDNPNQIVVAYNDAGRNGGEASVCTDGGTTFTRLTYNGQSPSQIQPAQSFYTVAIAPLGTRSGAMKAAAVAAWAVTSLPRPGTLRRPAGSISASTPAAVTIDNRAGPITTLLSVLWTNVRLLERLQCRRRPLCHRLH